MNALSAFLHPVDLFHPTRRYEQAQAQIAAALNDDLLRKRALTASLDEGARNVGLAIDDLRKCVDSPDRRRGAHAVIETGVAAIRLAAELPDPFRVSLEQSYQVVQHNAWADFQADHDQHRRPWASPHEGLGVIVEHAFALGDAAAASDVNTAELAAIRIDAMCIRYLGDLALVAGRWAA
ncbi:hypothetical protein [Mycobacteroides abscessus]